MDRLDLARISQASATQRAGRAGRTAPGQCLRLWSLAEHRNLDPFETPEIMRVDLAATVLALHAWGTRNPRAFGWFEQPPEEMLAAAEELLELLGAIKGGSITEMGRKMLGIPAHPRLARLLAEAAGTRLQNDALNLAALLSDDSRTQRAVDPLSLLERLPEHLQRIRSQLAGSINSFANVPPSRTLPESQTELLLLAYPDRIARRRPNDAYAATMVGFTGLRLAPDALTPALAQSELFLALNVHHDPRNRKAESIVHIAAPIDEATIRKLFPADFHTETTLEYSPQRQKPIAIIRHYFRDLLLRDSQGDVDPSLTGSILADALAPQAAILFAQNESAARILARTALLHQYLPEHPWPLFDENQLRELLMEAAVNKRSLQELTAGSALADALRSVLRYPLDRLLDQHAPETIEVPSGSHIRITYAEGQPPILAVRLQELFGWTDTPRLAAGRVPLILHLLAPNYRPAQVTSDLRSFWSNAYFEVRKDLRARYPKHSWPEDPLSAKPEAKGRPRR